MFKYKVGMFGGSFDPLHLGHVKGINYGLLQCEELHVVISYNRVRNRHNPAIIYRWIRNIFKHIDNLYVHLLEDTAKSKEEYNTEEYWQEGADDIRKLVGKPIDAVYCGTDYLGVGIFERMYPESEVVYFDRKIVPISSTILDFETIKHWDFIPQYCKKDFVKKILIVGSESTGKSTLVKNLALHYNTNYLREIGRDVCEEAFSEDLMTEEDLYQILIRHKAEEFEAVKHSNKFLFIDTDSRTTEFYTKLLLGDNEKLNNLSSAITDLSEYDLILFLDINCDFVQDGTRNEKIKEERQKMSNLLKDKYLLKEDKKLHLITGDWFDRFSNCIEIIDREFKILNNLNFIKHIETKEFDHLIGKKVYYNYKNSRIDSGIVTEIKSGYFYDKDNCLSDKVFETYDECYLDVKKTIDEDEKTLDEKDDDWTKTWRKRFKERRKNLEENYKLYKEGKL